jgi:hypothetical protein
MTVKELKELLKDAPDEMQVLIPVDAGLFDGRFLSPCVGETGVGSLGIDEESDETEDSFVIVPHGFFEEKHGVPVELN